MMIKQAMISKLGNLSRATTYFVMEGDFTLSLCYGLHWNQEIHSSYTHTHCMVYMNLGPAKADNTRMCGHISAPYGVLGEL